MIDEITIVVEPNAGLRKRGVIGKPQGVIMKNGWQTKEIGDIWEVIAGQPPEGKFYNTNGFQRYLYERKVA